MKNIRKLVLLVMLLAIIPIASIGTAIAADYLYVGDGNDDTVRQFDAASGNFIGNFVSSASGGLRGPRGLLFENNGNLLVANQNQGPTSVVPSEIFQYDKKTGAFIKALVPRTDPNAPYNSRGIVLNNKKLYLADLGNTGKPGNVSVFDEESGKFLFNLDPNVFKNEYYHPRGIVFGPDGNLYVAVRDLGGIENHIPGTGGDVLRFTPSGEYIGVFIHDNGGVGQLNRPEGLVFGPDGNLYITSFRKDTSDTYSIRVYSKDGVFLTKIDLAAVGQPIVYAQALLFGPNGRLFVPVYYPDTDTGEVRRYNVDYGNADYGKYDSFVKAGGALKNPWYLTFGKTNPSTLTYRDGDNQDDNSQN